VIIPYDLPMIRVYSVTPAHMCITIPTHGFACRLLRKFAWKDAEAPQSPLGATVPTGDKETDSGFSERWTKAVIAFHRPIKTLLLAVTHHAARNPKHYLLGIAFFSLSLIVLGFFTNFYIENSEAELWKQKGSRTVVHGRWIDEEWKNEWQAQGRAYAHVDARKLTTMVHKGGENVVSRVGMLRNFEVVDTIRATPKYKEYCALYGKIPTGEDTPLVCEISGVSGFWLHNTSLFESDQEAAEAMSIDSLPGEAKQFADLKQIVGYPVFEQNGTLSGLSFLTNFVLDGGGAAIQLERDLLKRMLHLRQEWEEDENNPYSLEIISPISFPDEFNRGIVKDIPLVALVFVEMAIFTCIVFSKADWVHSRSMLGLGAVACVLLSIMTGYGLMFLIGVPFTSLTQARFLMYEMLLLLSMYVHHSRMYS
jgi:Niemann-Pick C1 protein